MNAIDDGDFPAAWASASLEQVCVSIADGDHQPPPQVERGVPFLVIGNIRDGRIDFSGTRFVSESYFGSLGKSRLPSRGDVLYSVTGSFGIPVLVTTDQPFCVQRHIAILKPAPQMFFGYLARALGTAAVFRQASNAATGTAQKTVGLKHLRKFTLPVAPLPEQHRIVEAIESYFFRLDDAVATLDRVQRNLKRYRAAVLKAAVEGRLMPTEAELARAEGRDYEPASVLLERILAERRRRWHEAGSRGGYREPVAPDTKDLPELPEGWCWSTADTVADLKGGITKGQKRKPADALRQVPYLRVANVQRGRLDLSVMKKILATEAEIDELRLYPGDVLFNEGGDRDKLGRGWVWNGELPECIHQNHVFRARILTHDLHPKFLSWYGNTSGQQYFFEQGKQTTNLASINLTKLRGLPVPIPPLVEQSRIVAEVERLLSLVEEAELLARVSVRRCARLRQSILKWAFEGRLADQDPSDEPVSVLLERIRSETSASRQSASKRAHPAR